MRANWIVAALALGAVVPAVVAQNQITVWHATGDYVVVGNAVRIYSPGEFKIFARDGGNYGVIQSITVDEEGVDGEVTVSVVTPDGTPGANYLGWIDLSNATSSTIADLRLATDLGYYPGALIQPTEADLLVGVLDVGTVHEDLTFGRITRDGDITIDTLNADLRMTGSGPLDGDLQVINFPSGSSIELMSRADGRITLGDPADTDAEVNGQLLISGDAAKILIYSRVGVSAYIHIGSNLDDMTIQVDEPANDDTVVAMKGHIDIDGTLDGTLRIQGPPAAEADLSGRIEIGHHIWDTGRIEVANDVAGKTGNPAISVDGVLQGEIRINGSLTDDTTADADIQIATVAETGALAIDWDGYDLGDQWDPNATIRLGTEAPYVVLNENAPTYRIYDVTCLVGDMNNDAPPGGGLTFDDISPFVAAVQGEAAYAAAYPGLVGSRIYHADCNCDGDVDFNDIDPFMLKLTDDDIWYAQYNCETCPARAAGGEDGAERLPEDPYAAAEVFLAYLADEQLETFVALVEQLVEHYADTPRGEFWSAVLEVLHAAQ